MELRHRIPGFSRPRVLGVVSPWGSISAGAKEVGSVPGHLQSGALAHAPGASFLSDGPQSRVSFQPEGAQPGGDLRTDVSLKESFVSWRAHGALQAGACQPHGLGRLSTALCWVSLDTPQRREEIQSRRAPGLPSCLACPKQDFTSIQAGVLCS